MKGLQPFFVICILIQLTVITKINGHREHKVHNIVLYPDKNSWCKTLAIKQIISYPGYKSEEIDNNVCVGACFSYSIPHTEPSDPGEVIVPYCDSCQPSETTWQHITLECEKDNINVETPATLVKRVQIIKNCSCSPCEKNGSGGNTRNHLYDINDETDDNNLDSHERNDLPDLIDLLNVRNETNIGASPAAVTLSTEKAEKLKIMLNHKLIILLQNIQENNSEYDKVQLMELLKMIQGPDHKISDKHIEDFVESLNTEHIELDIPKLKEVLIKYENSKLLDKHQRTINNNNNNKQNSDSDSNNNNSNSNSNLNIINSNLNNNNNNKQDHFGIEGSHHNLGHLKGSHIGMGLHDIIDDSSQNINRNNNNNNNDDDYESSEEMDDDDNGGVGGGDDNISTEEYNLKKLNINLNNNNDDGGTNINNNKHHNIHHHVGDIIGHGHLTRGPHGSLVIQPDNMINNNNNNKHEKLDVNPHELKPNHAGTMLSYSSHTDKTKSIDD